MSGLLNLARLANPSGSGRKKAFAEHQTAAFKLRWEGEGAFASPPSDMSSPPGELRRRDELKILGQL
jgi:hypothetical protein